MVSKPGKISIFRGWPCDTLLLGRVHKAQQSLANMQNPQPKALPPGKPPSNLDKMLLASLANRVIHHQGPRFGITGRKQNGVPGHV